MSEPLRLESLGDFLQKLISVYGRHWRGFAAILIVPSFLIIWPALWLERVVTNLAAATEMGDPAERLAEMSPIYFGLALYFVIYSLVQGAALGAIAAAVSDTRQGRPIAAGAAWRRVAGRHIGITTIGATYPLAFFTGVLVSTLVFLVPAMLSVMLLQQPLAAFLFLPILAVGIIGTLLLLARCALAVPVLMGEQTGALVAFRRSAALAKGNMIYVVIVLLIALLAGNVVLFAFEGPFLLARWLAGEGDLELLLRAAQVVAGSIGRAIGMPIPMLALCLLYHDLRDREGILTIRGPASGEGVI